MEMRNEHHKNVEKLTVANNGNHSLLEKNEAQQRLVTDLEIELLAVSNMITKLTTDLKSASSKIGNYKRVNRRDKEQEKGLIGRTLFDNVQGVID